MRLQIGLFGRTNVGKSSFLNMVSGQDVAITSPVPGTTTDVVEKTMELLPLGPVVFLDTGGLDDVSVLGEKRVKKTKKVLDRADIILLITEPDVWTEFEEEIYCEAKKRKTPFIIVINKIDSRPAGAGFINDAQKKTEWILSCSCLRRECRDQYVNELKKYLIAACPDDFIKPLSIVADLLPAGGLAVLIVPIDKEAPKGRIILPQVQVIRDALDHSAATLVVKESEYKHMLKKLKSPPDIVICDSQVVRKMVTDTPPKIPCTTFSIVFARFKGELIEMSRGVAAVDSLKPKDKVLIAEACSHHAIEDDIGRIKIPRWLRQYLGMDLKVDVCSGRDYPENLSEYRLVIHCGSCMLTRRETLFRIQRAREAGVPITNYGIAISFLEGVLPRVLSPFPAAWDAYQAMINNRKEV